MPKPEDSTVPKQNQWQAVHLFPKEGELRRLAHNLIQFDGMSVKGQKSALLDFLDPADEKQASDRWSDYWVTVAATHGLAFIERGSETCEVTTLAKYLESPGSSLEMFYRLWGLRFQLPFAQGKHGEWKKAGHAVQPLVTIASYLVVLSDLRERASGGALAFLTFEEIARYLMPQQSSDFETVQAVCEDIVRGAQPGAAIGSAADLSKVAEHFRTRLWPLFAKANVLAYDRAKIYITDERMRTALSTWLRFRIPLQLLAPNEAARREFFVAAFGRSLEGVPETLSFDLDKVGSKI